MAKFGNFEFIETSVKEVLLVKPVVRGDDRGFFLETYEAGAFRAAGITGNYVQDNHSSSKKGIVRGLHLQVPPHYQKKIVRATAGTVIDVAVKVYPENSPGYGTMVSARLSAENKHQLAIGGGFYSGEPILFAHGFMVESDGAEVQYKASSPYCKSAEMGLMPFDKSVRENVLAEGNPDLKQLVADGKIVERDANWPELRNLTKQIWDSLPKKRVIFDMSVNA